MRYTSIINGGTSATVSGLVSGRAMLIILMYGTAGVMITATTDGACVFGEGSHGITVSVSNNTLTINNGSSRNYRVTSHFLICNNRTVYLDTMQHIRSSCGCSCYQCRTDAGVRPSIRYRSEQYSCCRTSCANVTTCVCCTSDCYRFNQVG